MGIDAECNLFAAPVRSNHHLPGRIQRIIEVDTDDTYALELSAMSFISFIILFSTTLKPQLAFYPRL